MASSKTKSCCYGNEHHVVHVKGCRRGRPLCRWRRREHPKRRPCFCGAYPHPHRINSGACKIGMPAVLVRLLPKYLAKCEGY